MKFNIEKHVEKLDNDYGAKPKKFNGKNKYPDHENDGEIPEEFKHFTSKVEKDSIY